MHMLLHFIKICRLFFIIIENFYQFLRKPCEYSYLVKIKIWVA